MAHESIEDPLSSFADHSSSTDECVYLDVVAGGRHTYDAKQDARVKLDREGLPKGYQHMKVKDLYFDVLARIFETLDIEDDDPQDHGNADGTEIGILNSESEVEWQHGNKESKDCGESPVAGVKSDRRKTRKLDAGAADSEEEEECSEDHWETCFLNSLDDEQMDHCYFDAMTYRYRHDEIFYKLIGREPPAQPDLRSHIHIENGDDIFKGLEFMKPNPEAEFMVKNNIPKLRMKVGTSFDRWGLMPIDQE